MAKNGFQMIDAEMHVMEPVDLWDRYIDPEFKARAPRRLNERRWDIRTIVEGEVMAAMPGGDWPARSDIEEFAQQALRQFAERAEEAVVAGAGRERAEIMLNLVGVAGLDEADIERLALPGA